MAAHSSGNHAQALALAAGMRGIPAYIVMPENAAPVKVAAARSYGARIYFCTPVVAAEPVGAGDAYRSFKSGCFVPSRNPETIADGLRTSLGKITFSNILSHVHDIVLAREDSIVEALKIVWERMKLVIEPSAALPLAALFEGNLDVRGKRVGIILSGGNIDFASIRKFT